MAGRTTLKLTDNEKAELKKVTRKKNVDARTLIRAKVLLRKSEGLTIDDIAGLLKIHRNTVILTLGKYQKGGIDYAIYDRPRKSTGRGHGISQDAKDWIISVASKEPQYAGFLESSWTYDALTNYLIKNAAKYGHPELESVSKTSVRRILNEADNDQLKLRRNDKSLHAHDNDVQLMIELDDFFSSSPALQESEWPSHEPGEQLYMQFESVEPEEESAEDADEEPEILEESEETEVAEDIAAEEDMAVEDEIQEDAVEADVAVEEETEVSEDVSVEAAEEPQGDAVDVDSVPEDAPETAPVEDTEE